MTLQLQALRPKFGDYCTLHLIIGARRIIANIPTAIKWLRDENHRVLLKRGLFV